MWILGVWILIFLLVKQPRAVSLVPLLDKFSRWTRNLIQLDRLDNKPQGPPVSPTQELQVPGCSHERQGSGLRSSCLRGQHLPSPQCTGFYMKINFISLVSTSWVRLLDHMASVCLTLWEPAKLFFREAVPFLVPITMYIILSDSIKCRGKGKNKKAIGTERYIWHCCFTFLFIFIFRVQNRCIGVSLWF